MSANPFVWYELVTRDLDASIAFYTSVIGWRAEIVAGSVPRYAMLHAGDGAPVAGFLDMPDHMREAGVAPHWLGYIGCRDIIAATDRLRSAGGTLHRGPIDLEGVGRIAIVADPQGALFSLFQPTGEGEPSPPSNLPGHVGWRELFASDAQSAFDFYAQQFGWTRAEAIDMGEMGTYQLFAVDGVAIGGMMAKPDQSSNPRWRFYFNVAEIEAALERLAAAGGTLVSGPHPVPGGSLVALCEDVQGAFFALVAPTPAG